MIREEYQQAVAERFETHKVCGLLDPNDNVATRRLSDCI